MKIIQVSGNEHSKLNERSKELFNYLSDGGICFKFKLSDRLKERNLTVRECAKLTGLRLATISNLMNGTNSSINLHHLLLLMVGLRITNLNDIIEIYIPDSKKAEYEIQTKA